MYTPLSRVRANRPKTFTDTARLSLPEEPCHPERFWNHLGRAFYCAEKFAEATEAFARITRGPTTRIMRSLPRRSRKWATRWQPPQKS